MQCTQAPVREVIYTGVQATQAKTGEDHNLNSCGYWCAVFMLFIVLGEPPELLPDNPRYIKELLFDAVKEYEGGGVTQQFVMNRIYSVYGSPPQEVVENTHLRQLVIVSHSYLLHLGNLTNCCLISGHHTAMVHMQ
jgi:hypothetical protein